MAQFDLKGIITIDSKGAQFSLKKFGLAVSALAAGMVVFGAKSIKAFEQQENAVARLQRGIQNVTSARDDDISSLLDQASALQRVTRFGDEQIISAQGILSTFQLNQKQIERLTPRLIDLSEGIARVDGGLPDLENSAILVAKALGGEDTAGLSGALRRVGVIMTEHQEEVLTTGNMQERLSILTKILDGNFEGLGEALGKTTSGQLTQMTNALNDLQEIIGEVLAKALAPLIKQLTEWAQRPDVQKKIQSMIVSIVQFGKTSFKILMAVKRFFDGIVSAIANVILAVMRLIGWFDRLIQRFKNAPHAKALGNIGASLKNAFGGGVKGKQFGGAITAGQPTMVGEAGPELFVPGRSGTVVPNHRIGGGGMNVTINIGMYAGTPSEKRRIAVELHKALLQHAGMQNKPVSEVF